MTRRIGTATAAIASVLALGGVSPAPTAGQQTPFDTVSLGDGPSARACTLLERTIFRVDVLTLEVRFGAETTERIRQLVAAGASRDSVARAAMTSQNAFARIEFLRDVGMSRFLDGVREDLRKAARAGIIDRETYDEVSTSLPRWYGFLAERGVRKGDQLLYRVRGDTLRSGYRAVSGELLLDQTDTGPQRRLSVLGSYLVEGSSFREGLLDDLLAGETGGC